MLMHSSRWNGADMAEWTATQGFLMCCIVTLYISPRVHMLCSRRPDGRGMLLPCEARKIVLPSVPPVACYDRNHLLQLAMLLKEEFVHMLYTVYLPVDLIAGRCQLFYTDIFRCWCLFFTKICGLKLMLILQKAVGYRGNLPYLTFICSVEYSVALNYQASHPSMNAYLFPVPRNLPISPIWICSAAYYFIRV
jgi:hypothetical protein